MPGQHESEGAQETRSRFAALEFVEGMARIMIIDRLPGGSFDLRPLPFRGQKGREIMDTGAEAAGPTVDSGIVIF